MDLIDFPRGNDSEKSVMGDDPERGLLVEGQGISFNINIPEMFFQVKEFARLRRTQFDG